MSPAARSLQRAERAVARQLIAAGVPEAKAREMARGRCAPVKSGRSPSRGPRRQPEHESQVALFRWADLMTARHPELRWLFAVPNWIGTRTQKHGAYLKAEGRKSGVPDVILPIRRGVFVGLVIEMKVKPNRPTDVQRQWLLHFESQSWCVNVCYSASEASDVLLRYLA